MAAAATAASPPAAAPHLRVCIKKGRRLSNKPGCRAAFDAEVRHVSTLLGTPVWPNADTDADVGTDGDGAAAAGPDQSSPPPPPPSADLLPRCHYNPPVAFVSFVGDLTLVRAALAATPGGTGGPLRGVEHGGSAKWSIWPSTEGCNRQAPPAKNRWKGVTTGHRAFFKGISGGDKQDGGASVGDAAVASPALVVAAAPSSVSVSVSASASLSPSSSSSSSDNSFTASAAPPHGAVSLVAVNLTKPANLGSIYRLMACFGCGTLRHVHRASAAPPVWADRHRMAAIKALSRGCDALAVRELVPMDAFLRELKGTREALLRGATNTSVDADDAVAPPSAKRARSSTWATATAPTTAASSSSPPTPPRPPIVAIETATGAVDITGFDFPRECTIMVGSEGSGIDPKVLRAMAPGYDRLVYIPMHGPHHSLNVSQAVAIALYEYRRQHPAHATGNAELR